MKKKQDQIEEEMKYSEIIIDITKGKINIINKYRVKTNNITKREGEKSRLKIIKYFYMVISAIISTAIKVVSEIHF